MCLFSRLSFCAPVVANACGSSEPTTSKTCSKSFGRSSKGFGMSSKAARKGFEGPSGCSGRASGLRTPTGRPASVTQARLFVRAQLSARGAWGYWVGCCYQKQQNLYIYVFLFFHFLYDFSKSIGTTHPFNLNRKNGAGKLLTYFYFYKTAPEGRATPSPPGVRNRLGVCPHRYKVIRP